MRTVSVIVLCFFFWAPSAFGGQQGAEESLIRLVGDPVQAVPDSTALAARPDTAARAASTPFSIQPFSSNFSLLDPKTMVRTWDTVNAYVLKPQDPQAGYLAFTQIQKAEPSEATRLFPNELRAEFMVGYTIGSIGNLFFGRALQLQRPQVSPFDYQDRGWQLRLIKNF